MENLPWHGIKADQDQLSADEFLASWGIIWQIGESVEVHPSLIRNEDILVDGVNIFEI
jgi:hypothetical protein